MNKKATKHMVFGGSKILLHKMYLRLLQVEGNIKRGEEKE